MTIALVDSHDVSHAAHPSMPLSSQHKPANSAAAWQQHKPWRNGSPPSDAVLDETDREILELCDGNTSIELMLRVLGLTEVAVLLRLRRLFAVGYVDGIARIAGTVARAARARATRDCRSNA
jgi:hypothetical protein